jgi:hypothetical protein
MIVSFEFCLVTFVILSHFLAAEQITINCRNLCYLIFQLAEDVNGKDRNIHFTLERRNNLTAG